jgi:hypothetical protein
MNKASIASLLALSASMVAPGTLSSNGLALAQVAAPNLGTGKPASQIQMDGPEFAIYDNAVNKQTTPQTQAPAIEAYLTAYPKTAVKADLLQRLMVDYSQFDHPKAVETADKVLQLSPDLLQAYVIEVAFRREAADAAGVDPATKQTGLDAATDFAKKGLALNAPKPAGMADADFAALKAYASSTFYGTIAEDATAKKDFKTAVDTYKTELAGMTPAAAQTPAALQETYFLGQAYYSMTPPDYVNCTFYTTRAAALAPDQYKATLQPLATYCYKKYHGGADGYDAVVAAAKANVNPPAGFTIVPAPTDADVVHKIIAETPDLATLALSDKEFILQHGTPEDADKVFSTIKGKSVEIPDATVVAATADQLQVAVSDDSVQAKPSPTADFTFTMKTPLKTIPAVGSKITLTGTYTSYTQTPVMITMTDAEEVGKKAPVAKPVAH